MLYLERTVNSEVHLHGSSGDSILRKENSPSKRQLSCGVHHDVRDLKIDLKVEWRPRDNFLLAHADLGSKSFDESNVSLSFFLPFGTFLRSSDQCGWLCFLP